MVGSEKKIYIPFVYVHNTKCICDESTYPVKQESIYSYVQEAENLLRQQGKG